MDLVNSPLFIYFYTSYVYNLFIYFFEKNASGFFFSKDHHLHINYCNIFFFYKIPVHGTGLVYIYIYIYIFIYLFFIFFSYWLCLVGDTEQ